MRKHIILSGLIGLIMFQMIANPSLGSFSAITASQDPRLPEMNLQIVFVGISPSFVDSKLLNDSLNSQIAGVPYKSLGISSDLSGLGTLAYALWNFSYVFTSPQFYNNVETEMKNSATTDNFTGHYGKYVNAVSMKNWFSNSTNYNSEYKLPTNGYTLVLGNFSDLGAHWIQHRYWEYDSHEYVNRSFLNEFDVGRMFFIDLSIQDSYLARVGSDGPIQNLAKFNPSDSNGKLMIVNYFKDWITEVMYDLFFTDLLYSTPNFFQTYDANNLSTVIDTPPNSVENIDIYLLNNISSETAPYFTNYINTSMIKTSFTNLLPWYNWKVNVNAMNASSYPELSQKMKESYDPYATPAIPGDTPGGVDLYNLFEWIFSQITSGNYTTTLPFLSTATNTYPVFVFTFDSGYFGVSYKGTMDAGIAGASLFSQVPLSTSSGYRWSHLTLITQDSYNFFKTNQSQFTEGFTRDIIHETGHSVGLAHPFGFSQGASMVDDPMSYITYVYNFSTFRVDQAQRGEVYQAIDYGIRFIQDFGPNTLLPQQAFLDYNKIINTFDAITTFIDKMDYKSAYTQAWSFFTQAQSFYNNYKSYLSSGGSNVVVVTTTAGLSTITQFTVSTTTKTKTTSLDLLFILLPLMAVPLVVLYYRKKSKNN